MANRKNRQAAHITLTSEHWFDGKSQEKLRLSTVGTLQHRMEDDVWIVSYDESEATGMPGTRTSLSLYPDGHISLLRKGSYEMALLFNKGNQQVEHFYTPTGLVQLSFLTHEAKGELDRNGGDMELSYDFSIDNKCAVSTKVLLKIEAEQNQVIN